MKTGEWWWWKQVIFFGFSLNIALVLLVWWIMLYTTPDGFMRVGEPNLIVRNVEIFIFAYLSGFSIKKLYELGKPLWK